MNPRPRVTDRAAAAARATAGRRRARAGRRLPSLRLSASRRNMRPDGWVRNESGRGQHPRRGRRRRRRRASRQALVGRGPASGPAASRALGTGRGRGMAAIPHPCQRSRRETPISTCRRTCSAATNAWPRWRRRASGATAIPSPTARSAARATRSFPPCPMTGRPRPWRALRCARPAAPNTRTRPTAASMPSRSPAPTAGRSSPSTAAGHSHAEGEAALDAAVAVLRGGGIVAVKGIGGYHLMCDAADDAAVARLRARKHRPDKPLAVMFPLAGADGLDGGACHVDAGRGRGPRLRFARAADRAGAAARGLRPQPASGAGAGRTRRVPALQPVAPSAACRFRRAAGRHLRQYQRRAGADRQWRGRAAAGKGRRRLSAPRPADRAPGRRFGGAGHRRRRRPIRLGRGMAPLEIELPSRYRSRCWRSAGT